MVVVGWEQGVVCGGVGKEPELPDLNKVNFPAIWPVFGIEGEALKPGRDGVRKLCF